MKRIARAALSLCRVCVCVCASVRYFEVFPRIRHQSDAHRAFLDRLGHFQTEMDLLKQVVVRN